MFTDKIKTNEDMKKIANCENAILSKKKRRKLSDKDVNIIREMFKDGKGDTEIARKFNCSRGSIYGIRKGLSYVK